MNANALHSTRRFSNRVVDYVRYRPDYPAAMMRWLHRDHGIDASWRVADVGAGTGISAKMFLDAGNRVIAVEPNPDMRIAAEHWLGDNERFRAMDGRADATGLADASVDLVIRRASLPLVRPRGRAPRIRTASWVRMGSLRSTGIRGA